MTLGELLVVLGLDTSQIEGAEEKLKDFGKTTQKSFEKTADAADDVEEGLGGILGAGKALTPVFIAAGAAAGVMLDWFRKTEAGADALTYTTSVLGEVMDSVMLNRATQYKEAISIAAEENRLRGQSRIDMVEIAYLQAQQRKDRMSVYDIDADINEKISAQNQALETQKQIESKLTAGLFEQLAVVERRLALNPTHTKSLDKQRDLQVEILNIQNSGSLMMQRTLNTLLKQKATLEAMKRITLSAAYEIDIADKMDAGAIAIQNTDKWGKLFGNTVDLIESKVSIYKNTLRDLLEFGLSPASKEVQSLTKLIKELETQLKSLDDKTKVLEGLDKVTAPLAQSYTFSKYKAPTRVVGGGLLPGGKTLAHEPYMGSMEDTNNALQNTISLVNRLESTFQSLFTNIGGGFSGMVNSMIDSLQLLIAELLSKAIIFGILSLIAGGTSNIALGAGKLIEGGLGKFLFKGFAGGTMNAPGGLALVGERGPELVNLPRGSQVFPNHMLGAANNSNERLVAEIGPEQIRFILSRNDRYKASFS